MNHGTITTTYHKQQRVSFSCPEHGYNIDDLDALAVAIQHARSRLLEQQAVPAESGFRILQPSDAFSEQQSSMAAPS